MTREEAIEILEERWRYSKTYKYTDAEIREAFDMAIKSLEQQPCEDCISREAMWKVVHECETHNSPSWVWREMLSQLPSVTPTRPTGQWIDIQYFKADDTYYRPKCPFCSIEPKEYSNYCPNCGADMREGEEEKNDE